MNLKRLGKAVVLTTLKLVGTVTGTIGAFWMLDNHPAVVGISLAVAIFVCMVLVAYVDDNE